MAGTLASLFVELGVKNKTGPGLASARTDFKKVGADLKSIGGGFSKAFTLPAIAAGAALLKIGSDHDAMVDTIRIGTGLTGDALKQLDQDAQAVFANIPTSMALTGQAFSELFQRTGQTGAGLMNLAQSELELARITDTDLSTNIANTTRLFGDWGIAVDKQVPTLDKLFRASQATGIGVDMLSEQMVKFGAPLRQIGFGFDETAALLGKFEKEGVNSELVMGSLRIALGKMAKEGIEDPKQALSLLVDQIKNAGSAGEANALALETFGARAGPDMAAAIREGRFDVGALFDQITNGTDTINSAAISTNDWRENLQILTNRIQVKLIPIADKAFALLNEKGIPALETIADKAETVIRWFSTLPRPLKIAAAAFAGLLVAIGPVLIVLGTIIGAIAPAIPIITALLGAISLPVLAVIGVIVLLAVAWRKNWFDIRGKTKAVIGAILGILSPFVKKFVKATETIRHGIGLIVKAFKRGGLKGALKEVFGEGGKEIAKGLGRILGLPARIIGQFLREIRTGFAPLDAVLHNVGAMFQDVGLIIQAVFSGQWRKALSIGWDLLKRYVKQFMLIGELLLGVFRAIPWGDIGSALWDGLKAAVGFLVDTGAPWLLAKASKLMGKLLRGFGDKWESDIRPWLLSLPGKIVSLIEAGAKAFFNAGRDVVSWIWTGISSLVGWFESMFHAIPNTIIGVIGAFGGWFFNIGRDIVSGIWTGISSLGGWLWNMVWSFIKDNTWGAAKNALGIDSPSKEFAKLGKWSMHGFAKGVEDHARVAATAVNSAMSFGGVAGANGIAGIPAGAGGMAGGVVFSPGSIVVTAQPGQSEERIAELTAARIVRKIELARAGAVR